MDLPPIVPGPGEPDQPPTAYIPPPQPLPVYYPQPPQPPWNPGRAAGNTVVVVLTLVGVFCGLPLVVCLLMAACGALLPTPSSP
jgi:hypothetical protein